MNARNRRPARKTPQRWRTWGCTFAMGLVATPLHTLALAYSEPHLRGAELLAMDGDPAQVAYATGSESSGWASHSPQDLWGDVPPHESSLTLEQRVVHSASDTYRDLQAGAPAVTPAVTPRAWETPREWQEPADAAIPLPAGDIGAIPDRPEVRQRLLATLGWTAATSHSSDVCRTPGTPENSSRAAESSSEALLDGFRARGMTGSKAERTGKKKPAVNALATVADNSRNHRLQATPPSSPSGTTERSPLRPAPKRPRVTPVNSAEHADVAVSPATDAPVSEEILRPRTVQADFRLEPVPEFGHRPAADVKASGWQTSDVAPERLAQLSAEELSEEVSELATSVPGSTTRPRSRTAVMSGVSDEDPAIGTSQLALTPPVTSRSARGPILGEVSDVSPEVEVEVQVQVEVEVQVPKTPRQPQWHGVTDQEEPVRAGVSDAPSLAQAGVSDEEESVWAGVSDEESAIRESVSDDKQPQFAGVSDDEHPILGSVSDENEPALAGVSDEIEPTLAGVTDENEPTLAGVSDGVSDGDDEQRDVSLEPARPAELLVMPAMELRQPRVLASPRTIDGPRDLALEAANPRALDDEVESREMDQLDREQISAADPLSELVVDREPGLATLSSPDQSSVAVSGSSSEVVAMGNDRKEPIQSYGVSDIDDENIDDEDMDEGPSPGNSRPKKFLRLDLAAPPASAKSRSARVARASVSSGDFDSGISRQADNHEQLVTHLARQYPHADIELMVSDDRVIVEGRVRSNQEAVAILSQVRRVWLVPVEDRIVVRR